jgi:MHS family proline/betaine transporter-like MFS transporter
MIFIEKTLHVEFVQTRNIIALAILLGTPLFIYFGWWSDKIGRKMIMMVGMLLAVLLYRPIYQKMYDAADLSGKQEIVDQKLITRTTGTNKNGEVVTSTITQRFFEGGNQVVETKVGDSTTVTSETVLSDENFWKMTIFVLIQVVLVTMVYGPIAAFLVEMFPTRIRYTSMSLPYHIGNGIFGGMVPFVAVWLYDASKSEANPAGDPFAGLWYPIAIAGLSFLVGMTLLKNKPNEVED